MYDAIQKNAKITAKRETAARKKAGEGYRECLVKPMKDGGGGAHKVASGNQKGATEVEYGCIILEENAEPHRVVRVKAEYWQEKWSLPIHRKEPDGWLDEIKKLAQAQSSDQIKWDEVREAVQSAPAKSAEGMDHWIPANWGQTCMEKV